MQAGANGWSFPFPTTYLSERKYARSLEYISRVILQQQLEESNKLEEHQKLTLENVEAIVTEDNRKFYLEEVPVTEPIIIVAPKGSGKSGIIVRLQASLNSDRTLVLTPSIVFAEQLRIAFAAYKNLRSRYTVTKFFPTRNEEQNEAFVNAFLGLINVIYSSTDADDSQLYGGVSIAITQKFADRARLCLMYKKDEIINDVEPFFQKFDTLIVDEAQHYPVRTWERFVTEFNKQPGNKNMQRKKIVFLTTTPYRNVHEKLSSVLRPGNQALRRVAHEITPDTFLGKTLRRAEFRESEADGSGEVVLKDLLEIFDENLQREPRLCSPKAVVLVRRKKQACGLVNYFNAQMKNYTFSTLVDKLDNTLDSVALHKYRVLVTTAVGKENYSDANIVACVVLMNLVKERILFDQFVERCMTLHRCLPGEKSDMSIGVVLSYQKFNQKKMWDERDHLAEFDPVEIDQL